MFTGLIRHCGTLAHRTARSGGARLRVQAPIEVLDRAESGASIAVNGVCLTAIWKDDRCFDADLSEETLTKTTLGRLATGDMLHLEPALRMGDPLDGHIVQGHVDVVGRLLERRDGEGLWRFSLPVSLAPMVAPKGSIAVDGLSLTVVDAARVFFTVAIIPETLHRTRLASMRAGAEVNLEADVLARYAARFQSLLQTEAHMSAFAKSGWAD